MALLLFPFLAHHFSPRQYGTLDILTLVAILANLTVALEVNQGLGRYFMTPPEERVDYASTALLFTIGAYTVFAAIALPLAVPLTHALLAPASILRSREWRSSGSGSPGSCIWPRISCAGAMRPRAYGLVAVTTAAVTAIATVVLVLGFGVSASAGIGQLAGALAAGALLFVLSRGAYAPRFDRRKLGAMLAFSLPLVPSSIGVFLNGFADRLVLQHSRSLTDVGIYGSRFASPRS